MDPCMFCHDGLAARADGAENLAFLDHIQRRPECAESFGAWTEHMQSDWVGD
jgi:hypothetical protein